MDEITYALERDDYWQFNLFAVRRDPALKRQSLRSLFLLPAIVAVELWFLHFSPAWYLLLPVIGIVWYAYLTWAQKRILGKQAEKAFVSRIQL